MEVHQCSTLSNSLQEAGSKSWMCSQSLIIVQIRKERRHLNRRWAADSSWQRQRGHTSRKTLIGRNNICDARKKYAPQEVFLWRTKKYAPEKFIISVAHVGLVRHKTLPFCGACGWKRHRIFMGLTRGLALHMGEGNSVAHLPHAPQKIKIMWRICPHPPQKVKIMWCWWPTSIGDRNSIWGK
jgi:hypothetical protein